MDRYGEAFDEPMSTNHDLEKSQPSKHLGEAFDEPTLDQRPPVEAHVVRVEEEENSNVSLYDPTKAKGERRKYVSSPSTSTVFDRANRVKKSPPRRSAPTFAQERTNVASSSQADYFNLTEAAKVNSTQKTETSTASLFQPTNDEKTSICVEIATVGEKTSVATLRSEEHQRNSSLTEVLAASPPLYTPPTSPSTKISKEREISSYTSGSQSAQISLGRPMSLSPPSSRPQTPATPALSFQNKPPSPPRERAGQLTIGIDFGTTYTGVAFIRSTSSPHSQSDLPVMANKLKLVTDWPNQRDYVLGKTPTRIGYKDGKPVSWGGKAVPEEGTQISRYFKLRLQEGIEKTFVRRARGANPASLLSDNMSNLTLGPTKKPPEEIVRDYLYCVLNHVHQKALPTQFGKRVVDSLEISYVLTVPAIWDDGAKHLTRTAAERAGILSEKLTLITEPEAAALYCATICEDLDLQNGDRFLVCDAGGGTVIINAERFEIEECSQGSGAPAGAIYLNDAFERLIRSRLGSSAKEVLTEKCLEEAMTSFDRHFKVQFNPLDEDCRQDFWVPMPGAPDNASINLNSGFLVLSKGDMDSVFKPIFDIIFELVQEQIASVIAKHGSGINALFLVGGFGSNQYLRRYLETKLPEVQIVNPSSGLTAIVRGAVLHKLGIGFITQRVSRRHYGVQVTHLYQEGEHPVHLKFMGKDGWRCPVMRWFVNNFDSLPDGHKVEFQQKALFLKRTVDNKEQKHTVTFYECNDKVAPKFPGDAGARRLCSVTVDVSSLPRTSFTEVYGPNGLYYTLDLCISVTFGSAVEFRYLSHGMVLGETKVDFSKG